MSKKKKRTANEDESLNGSSSLTAGEAPLPEAAPPSFDPAIENANSANGEAAGTAESEPSTDLAANEPPDTEAVAPPPIDEPLTDAPTPPLEPPPYAPAPEIPVATPSSPEFTLPVPAPVAQPVAPVATIATVIPDPNTAELLDRIRRLEGVLAQTLEQRITERTPTPPQPPPQPQNNSGPSLFGQARAWFDVGRHLLPALPQGQAPTQPRGWLMWELLAEVRAMCCMYLDPRYQVSWWAYALPPILFVAFLFTKFWVPFALVLEKANLAFLVVVPVDLVLMYVMFKVLGHEARRYRETAPDLPPSLRL